MYESPLLSTATLQRSPTVASKIRNGSRFLLLIIVPVVEWFLTVAAYSSPRVIASLFTLSPLLPLRDFNVLVKVQVVTFSANLVAVEPETSENIDSLDFGKVTRPTRINLSLPKFPAAFEIEYEHWQEISRGRCR